MRRILRLCLTFLALSGAGLAAVAVRAADEEKGVLASLISRALSTPDSRVSIGSIEGALSSVATVRDIQLSDRDGVWLRLDRARIDWRRLALLQRRLEVEQLDIGELTVLRRPVPAEAPVPGEDQPLLPELPVKVEIKDFRLARLVLGEPILGTPAQVTASGRARLGNPAEGLDLTLDARRLDAPGTLAARLGLVPQGQRLDLALLLDEPAGGVLARAANIPGLPPVRLDLTGQGTLDAFAARLAFTAGSDIGAGGTATVSREGPARRIALDVAAQISGLLPAVAAPVFAGTTRVAGTATYGDDGAIGLPGLTLTAAAARLDVSGTVSPDQVADLRITAVNVPSSGARTQVSGADIRRLAFDARITGSLATPRVAATLAAEDARLPAGRLDKLDARFDATPTGNLADAATRIRLAADARAEGVVPANPGLGQALGGTVTLALRGTANKTGPAEIDTLEIRTPTLTARYAGRLGASELRGRAEIALPDLARFRGVAGLPLRGAATVGADLEGTPRANRYNAILDGRATRLATGLAAIDGLSGGQVSIAGAVRLTPTGDYVLDNLRLAGEHATLRLDGAVGQETAALDLAAAIPELRRADERLSGRANLTGRVTGGLQRPGATLRLEIADATALGRPVPRLAVDARATDITGNLDATVALDGQMDRKPARGTLHLARRSDGSLVLDTLDVLIGSVAVRGAVTLDPGKLASGRVAVAARDLDDLSPLLLTRLSGALDADVTLAVVNGGQNAALKASGQRVAAYEISADRLTADLALTDIYRRPVIAGRVAIDEASVGGERIARVRLDATGTAQASDVVLTAAARGFDLDARARVVPGDRTRIELSQFGATRDGRRLGTVAPATFTIVDGGVDIRSLALAIGAGRVTVEGRAGSRLDLKVAAQAVPLAALEIVAPGLGLAGTLDASADIGGAASAPTGEYRARVNGLAAPQTRNAGLPPIDVTASGRLEGERATIDATLGAGRVGTLRIGGSVPIDAAGALDVTIRGAIDAGAATTRLLGAAGRRLTGRVAVDAKVGGTLANPQAGGTAVLTGGSFSDAAQGIAINALQARIVARGEEIVIESASARTRNDGTLSASGRVRLDPGGGFPGQIRITGRRAELTRTPLATAIADLDLQLAGALARDPRVTGRVGIVGLDVNIAENLSTSLRPLPGTRHLNPTPTTRARLARDGAQRGTGRGQKAPPPFDAALDLTISAPDRIFVRGRGLNAILGGNLRLTGTLAKPVPVGAFELRTGRLQILTSRLDFSRGRLTFTGDLTPELDFVASTNAGGAAIQIAINGPASSPNFAFTSSPDLPQDEVLSRLLFNSPSGQLTTTQALALAQAAAQFSGGGDDTFESLRRSLGLQGLDVGATGLGLERALGDRVSIGVNAGVNTGVGINVRVTDEIKIKGEVGATGGTSVGIAAEYEW
jgi:translocation and assembly module TamB